MMVRLLTSLLIDTGRAKPIVKNAATTSPHPCRHNTWLPKDLRLTICRRQSGACAQPAPRAAHLPGLGVGRRAARCAFGRRPISMPWRAATRVSHGGVRNTER